MSAPRSISRRDWTLFAALAAVLTATAAVTGALRPEIFGPFFGARTPALVIFLAALVGALSLRVLSRTDATTRGILAASPRVFLISAGVALPFVAIAVTIDLTLGFPRDINVTWPWSLTFYPVMAFVVECTLHAAPYAFVYWAGRTLALPLRVTIPAAIVVAALPESLLQMGYAGGGTAPLLAAIVGVHVFAINVVQLTVFWRYGFWAMLTVRLAYYALWHVAWGEARLFVVF